MLRQRSIGFNSQNSIIREQLLLPASHFIGTEPMGLLRIWNQNFCLGFICRRRFQMTKALIQKLHRFQMLDADDAAALDGLSRGASRYLPYTDIISTGSNPKSALIILSGWAIRYVVLKDGNRQITSFLLPGDFCHLNMLSDAPMDHSIAPLSPVTAVCIKRDDLQNLFSNHPNIAKAVQASQFADESRLRAAITNLGRHNAEQRLGYMLCDIWCRAEAVGLIEDNCLHFPPTQPDIADAIGLTGVHVNRMMQRLRGDGLLELKERSLTLPDFTRLAHASGYSLSATGNRRDHASKLNGYVSFPKVPSTNARHFS